MDIEAERLNFANAESVLRVGRTLFEEPYVKLCIQDSVTDGTGGFASLVVDVVPYTKATALAAGFSEEEADAQARFKYLESLTQHDVDGFEAEMFWEAYYDIEWHKANPYAVVEQNPYLMSADTPPSADEGWGPRNMQRTPGAVD